VAWSVWALSFMLSDWNFIVRYLQADLLRGRMILIFAPVYGRDVISAFAIIALLLITGAAGIIFHKNEFHSKVLRVFGFLIIALSVVFLLEDLILFRDIWAFIEPYNMYLPMSMWFFPIHIAYIIGATKNIRYSKEKIMSIKLEEGSGVVSGKGRESLAISFWMSIHMFRTMLVFVIFYKLMSRFESEVLANIVIYTSVVLILVGFIEITIRIICIIKTKIYIYEDRVEGVGVRKAPIFGAYMPRKFKLSNEQIEKIEKARYSVIIYGNNTAYRCYMKTTKNNGN